MTRAGPVGERARMVEIQLRPRGVTNEAVLGAMASVPRERFVPAEVAELAYEDRPLPIGEGQTISQPYIVAIMTQALQVGPGGRVLEIGTGSGYGAAVLSRVVEEVVSIERRRRLAEHASTVLGELHYDNVTVVHGDGTLGFPQRAPYDGIVVTAGAPRIPEALYAQLAEGGSLVIPVGEKTRRQTLLRATRRGDHYNVEDLGGVRFVPLVGAQGWEGRSSESRD